MSHRRRACTVRRVDELQTDLTRDALTARVRVWQRKRGHRYSFDDVVTAWVAARAMPYATRHLDLGCGIGSVLLMVADRLPAVRSIGVEAQAQSFALACRNVADNGLAERVRVLQADLRHVELEGEFDLITGTPPYKKPGTATASPDPQRAHARIELRGGIEEYLASAARWLAPEGTCVVCMEASGESRVQAGAQAAGFQACERLDVVPIAGRKAALFSVFTLRRAHAGAALPLRAGELALRDEGGARTEAAFALRTFFGLSNPQHELPSPPRP